LFSRRPKQELGEKQHNSSEGRKKGEEQGGRQLSSPQAVPKGQRDEGERDEAYRTEGPAKLMTLPGKAHVIRERFGASDAWMSSLSESNRNKIFGRERSLQKKNLALSLLELADLSNKARILADVPAYNRPGRPRTGSF